MGGVLGASLQNTVTQVIGRESKKFRHRIEGDAAVAAELCTSLEAEETLQEKKNAEFQESMKQKKEGERIAQELKEVQTQLKTKRKDLRVAQAVVTAKEAVKSYSILA